MLKTLWAKGLSASEIANRMGGITRASVCGKAWRLGLPQRDAAKARTWRRKKESAPRINGKRRIPGPPRLRSEPVPPPRPEDIPTKTLMDLEPGDCRWRVDKAFRGEPYGFCAQESLPGLTVCASHAARMYANWPEIQHRYVEAKEKVKEAEPA